MNDQLIIHGKTFHNVLAKPGCCPLPEFGTLMAFYPVTYRYDDIEIIEVSVIRFTVGSSCSEIPNNCTGI